MERGIGLACALGALAIGIGCGDDDGGAPADGGTDAPIDAPSPAPDAGFDGGTDAGPPPPPLCAICRRDTDCIEGGLCLVLDGGERGCGLPCGGDEDCTGLPYDAACEEEVPGLPFQCRPRGGSCTTAEPGTGCDGDAACGGRYDRCIDPDGLGGRCTTECGVDADCPLGMRRCADTADGRVCVPDPLPAGERCEALADVMEIARCEADGSCPAGGVCAGTGALRLCLPAPTGSLEDPCPPFTHVVDVGGTAACAPDGCDCLFDVPGSLFDEALGLVGRTRCDLHFDSAVVDGFIPEVSHDPFRLTFTDRLWGDWPAAVPFAEGVALGLDDAGATAQPIRALLFEAAQYADLRETGGTVVVDDLGEAIARLVVETGGTADRAAIDAEVATLDPALAAKIAQIVEELRRAHQLREEALALYGPEDRARLYDGASGIFLGSLDDLDIRRSDLRGALLGDVDVQRLVSAAGNVAAAIDDADLASFTGATGDLTVDTPLGRIAVRGGTTDHTYADDEWSRTLLLVDLHGGDTYRFPAGATTGPEHGLAIVIDVRGIDDYGYDVVPVPADTGPPGHVRLPSDAAGRRAPPAGATFGPSSQSTVSRQGAGRLGVGMLIDLGAEGDQYRSHRMSQGYGALGVGILYDAGGSDVYHGEAAVQGAAGFGIGILADRDGHDRYLAYSESQGFAYARAVGVLWDRAGDDEYLLHPTDVLYWSPQDPGGSNSSLGQGMGFGRRGDADLIYMSGGLGVLRDATGTDRYTAGIFAQASGYWFGTGLLIDSSGNDRYDAQWYAQSGSAHFAISVLLDTAGNDVYNETARRMNVTLGGGHDFSIAWMIDRAGDDTYYAPSLSVGAGNDEGAGIFADAAGTDTYDGTSDFAFGNAHASGDAFRIMSPTLGLFMDADGADTYTDPMTPPPANDTTWTQSHTGGASEQGAGVDRAGELGI